MLVASATLALVNVPDVATPGPADAAAKFTKAPNFRAFDLAGEHLVLDDLLGHGPIVVEFWSMSSKASIQELLHIQRLHDDYEDTGVQLLAVTIDSPQGQRQIQTFAKSRKFDACVVMDAERDVFRKLGGTGPVPYTVILDEHGSIRFHHTGYHPGDEEKFRRVVNELLAEAERGENL
jgi:peroxiredoxin